MALGCSSAPGEPASRSLEPDFFVLCVSSFLPLCPLAGRAMPSTFQSGSLGPGTRSPPRRVEGCQGPTVLGGWMAGLIVIQEPLSRGEDSMG